MLSVLCSLFVQAEDGIRDLVRSRGLGDVYKRQMKQLDALRTLPPNEGDRAVHAYCLDALKRWGLKLSLIHI